MRQTKAKAHAIEAKHLVAEKGHAKPSNYFDFHGSVLIVMMLIVANRKFWLSFSGSSPIVWKFGLCLLIMGSRKVDFDRFILLSKWKRMVLSVVSHHRDDFNFGYDRKRKSSQVSMLVLELKKEAVSNYGMTVLNSFKLCWLLVWSGIYMLYCEAIENILNIL
ncbi:hypothetical protein F2Q68_00034100 [Brassica cretica]|uniref:Transmembrane protein n=1 Tax=Brassica cretica TaxID=69181 RepID=A0A8S9HAE5_BRACR|nr:hypothetical protein F2Q68_00034100 [Brassica cretica]